MQKTGERIKLSEQVAQRKARERRMVRGTRYDAAETSRHNEEHWSRTSSASADVAADHGTRHTLRVRARYEVANNCYAAGIVETVANDTIGTGPRLQMLTDDPALNQEIEQSWQQWAEAAALPRKLRQMRMARAVDGEAFAQLRTNPRLAHSVRLDLLLLEADRVQSPLMPLSDPQEVDGVFVDEFGDPVSYRVLTQHPGSDTFASAGWETYEVDAEQMIHLFTRRRAEQHRGVPELQPALPLFAQLRRYTLAVISAAETIADFAGILTTRMPANGEAQAIEAWDQVELVRNMLMTAPEGWNMEQPQPRQPAATYAEFKNQILNEIARCLQVPFNVAALNSSDYNYASGRLDHQTYFKNIQVDQSDIARDALDHILRLWLQEYAQITARPELLTLPLPKHQWFWDGMEHVDPKREADAEAQRLNSRTTTLARIYARQGMDWEDQIRQLGREKRLLEEEGLSRDEVAAAAAGAAFAAIPDDGDR